MKKPESTTLRIALVTPAPLTLSRELCSILCSLSRVYIRDLRLRQVHNMLERRGSSWKKACAMSAQTFR